MIDGKTSEELQKIIKNAERELELRSKGEQLPIYIFSDSDTNNCFKDKDVAIEELTKVAFNPVDTEDFCNIRLFVRWVPVADYETLPQEWMEV